jgi:hypothetical protein
MPSKTKFNSVGGLRAYFSFTHSGSSEASSAVPHVDTAVQVSEWQNFSQIQPAGHVQ